MTRLLDRLFEVLRPHAGWLALAAGVALTCIGILAIGTVPQLPGQANFALNQTWWLVIALAAMLFTLVPTTQQISRAAFVLMIVSMAMLAFVVLPLPDAVVPTRNGTRAWIDLKFMLLQPSELAKIVFVLALARYLRYRSNYRTLRGLLVPFGIMFIPVALILKEPDLGTALLFPPALFAVLIAAGAKKRHIFALLAIGLIAVTFSIVAIYKLPASFQPLKPHQRMRIVALVSQIKGDRRYVQNEGYQQDKAMTLVGSGELHGFGADRSTTILKFNVLPEAHNDMVFAVVANRWGWVGGVVTLGLYALLDLSILLVATRSKDPFVRLSCVGFAALLFTQMLINVGMSLGVIPIIGITLPFISYGGSSLVATFVMLGLVFNFASKRPALLTRPSFEYDDADAELIAS